jgi:anti-sigma regulatory factor (Ser/Thr protein kinase)
MAYFEVQLTKKLHRLYEVGPDTVIGRAPQCEIQLLSRAVSRRHARIEFDGTQAIVSDLGTKNGIKLNGERIQGAAVVSEGDLVVVGDIRMIYRTADRSIASKDIVDLRDRAPTAQDVQAAMVPKATYLLRADANRIAEFQKSIARARIAGLEFDEICKFKLQVALREAIENARLHGCSGDRNRFIHVTFSEDADEFVMSITDEGDGFDVNAALGDAPEFDALQAVRNRVAGEPWGLKIMLNCVDRIQFAGRGATIYLGKVKAAGQLLILSEESDLDAVDESASEHELKRYPPPGPFPDSDEGPPIAMGDLF